jgi:hypothetical protein
MARPSPEARARLAAEADLLRKKKAEFERLLLKKDRVRAIVALVEKHKAEYDELVKRHRAKFEAGRAA